MGLVAAQCFCSGRGIDLACFLENTAYCVHNSISTSEILTLQHIILINSWFILMQNSLRHFRKKQGYTLKKLSESTGIGLSTLGNFEKGVHGISDEKIRIISERMGVSTEEILSPSPKKSINIPRERIRSIVREADGTVTYNLKYLQDFSDDDLCALLLAAMEAPDWSLVRDIADELNTRELPAISAGKTAGFKKPKKEDAKKGEG